MTSASHLEQAASTHMCQPAGILQSTLTWAQPAPSSPWAATVDTAAEVGEGALRPQGGETRPLEGRGLTSLLMEAQTSWEAGHPYCAKSYKLPQILC